VSRRRADRLSSFYPNTPKSAAISHESLTDLVSLGTDNLCHGFPSPKTFGFTSKISQENFKEDGDSGDEKSDAPSTSSNVSLTRLRFVVTSMITLRDAGAVKESPFNEYLSRSLVTFDGKGFVGEPFGLNGCSRETLDFFVSYNPDYALILDCHTLQEALSNQDHISLSYLVEAPLSPKRCSVQSPSESIVSGNIPPQNHGLGARSADSHRRLFQLNMISVILSTVSEYIGSNSHLYLNFMK
jgi:hypothetical protein